MKVIIDLIEDIREEIDNQKDFILTAILLKDDPEDTEKLLYGGEASIALFELDESHKQLVFRMDSSAEAKVTVGELVKPLLILSMNMMMYELRIDVNAQYHNMEVVGFGKSFEEKKYILFLKL